MALTAVDLFEALDVDEREHERGAGAICALELARHLLEPETCESTRRSIRPSSRT